MSKIVASTFHQLDVILSTIWVNKDIRLTFTGIAKMVSDNFGDNIPFGDILSILKRLEKDGYIEYDDRAVTKESPENRVYRLTFDGRFWIEQGGYRAEADRRKTEADRGIAESIRAEKFEIAQKDYQTNMIVLTVILSLGTAISAMYYLVELYWKYHWFRFGK